MTLILNVDEWYSKKILIVFDAMILNSSLKWKKQDFLLLNQIWFRDVLEKVEWFQYWILVEILNEDMRNLRFEFEMLLISSQMLRNRNRFVESTNVIIKIFRTRRIDRMLIWETMLNKNSKVDLRILLKCWITFWFNYEDYRWNKREKIFDWINENDFVKFSSKINDFCIKFLTWCSTHFQSFLTNIEFTFQIEKYDRSIRKTNMISQCFRKK